MKNIMNKNLKRLIRKLNKYEDFSESPRALRHEFLCELKFARLIIPDKEFGNNFYVFTDLKEFNKVYKDIYEPVVFEIVDFGNTIYSIIEYLIVNNSYKLNMNYVWHCIEEELSYDYFIEEYSHKYSLEDTLILLKSFDNAELIDYLNGRKYIQSYMHLFETLKNSVLFADIDIDCEGDIIENDQQTEAYFNIREGFIHTFTDLNSFNLDHFSVVDMFELIAFVLYYQLNGIIIESPQKQTTLSRRQLINHFDEIREYYFKYNLTDTFKYIFKVGIDYESL